MPESVQIRPLADHVIDQIAAGEVIERPASIVKELIENSIDAGATRITIELEGGGIERISVRDDGSGIDSAQLSSAVLRHYTSKLRNADELAAIATLGFRGEALASIAAVAEFAVISRTADAPHGWRLATRPGEAAPVPVPEAHPPGTTVDVRRLFDAIPARRRFLKRPRTEFLQIQQLVRRAAFCYPAIAFRLIHDGRQNLSLTAARDDAAATRRWRSLFGVEFVDNTVAVDAKSDGNRVSGWIGRLDFSRQNADLQYLAINHRIVRDRNVAHAIRMAYDDAIPAGRHAAYALHVEMPPGALDVNVHPGKAEVRFREPRMLHDFVTSTVRRALAGESPSAGPAGYAAVTTGPAPGVAERSALPGTAVPTSSARMVTSALSTRRSGLLALVDDRFAIVDAGATVHVLDVREAIRQIVSGRIERGECSARPLIFPESVPATLPESTVSALDALGVEIRPFGEARSVLRTLPVVTSEIENERFVEELLRLLGEGVSPIAAVAGSAAAAFRAPAALAERRDWFAGVEHYLEDMSLRPGRANLDAAALASLMSPVSRGSV